MVQRRPPVGEFLDELSARLDALGTGGVTDRLMARAQGLRPSERDAFLAIFNAAPTAASDGDDVLELVAVFVHGLERRLDDRPDPSWYHRRGGWNDWDDEEDDGDDDLIAELDDLFGLLGERFLAGDVVVALTGYEQLLGAVVSMIDHPSGVSLGGSDEIAREAFTRALWCAATLPEETAAGRALRFVALYDDFGDVGWPTLVEVIAVSPGRDCPPDETLAAIALLLRDVSLGVWDNRRRRELLCEITFRLDGEAGMLALARDLTSSARLETYQWLVAHYRSKPDQTAAATAADEALDALGDSHELAALADVGAHLHRELGNDEAARGADLRAWSVSPTSARLEWVLNDLVELGSDARAEVMDELAATSDVSSDLLVILAILRGDLDEVSAGGGWRVPTRAVEVADRLVFAAYVGAGAGVRLPGVDHMIRNAIGPRAGGAHLEALAARRTAVLAGGGGELPAPPRRLVDATLAAVTALPSDPARLDDANALLDRSAAVVLGGKLRGAYGLVAEMVVVLAEGLDAAGRVPRELTVERYDREYRRFSAFRKELAAAVRSLR